MPTSGKGAPVDDALHVKGTPAHTEDMEMLTGQEILDARLDDWRKLGQAFHARFLTGDFVTGLRFVTAVAEAAETAGHHPDVTLTYPLVDLKLISHDALVRVDDGAPEGASGGSPSATSTWPGGSAKSLRSRGSQQNRAP